MALDPAPSHQGVLTSGDLVVVKVGGGGSLRFEELHRELAALDEAGIEWVLVHGGNAEMTRLQEAVGRPARFVSNGQGRVSRYTDGDAIDLFSMAYAGKLNVRHVCNLRALGVDALGLTGVDGGLLVAKRRSRLRCVEDGKKMVLRDDHTGSLVEVNAALLRMLLDAGYRPVVTVPAYAAAPEGEAGVPVNVDGDTCASKIAVALGADALVFLSDVPGLLRDVRDPDSRIDVVSGDAGWAEAMDVVDGRMHRKLEGARDAVRAGVAHVAFGSANHDRPVMGALSGDGTLFTGPFASLDAASAEKAALHTETV